MSQRKWILFYILFVALSHCDKGFLCLSHWVTVTKDFFVCRTESLQQRIFLFVALSHCDKGFFCLSHWVTATKKFFVCRTESLQQRKYLFGTFDTTIEFSAISALVSLTWMWLSWASLLLPGGPYQCPDSRHLRTFYMVKNFIFLRLQKTA